MKEREKEREREREREKKKERIFDLRKKVLLFLLEKRTHGSPIFFFSHAPPTVGAPLVATPSEAPSHESVLLFSRLSRWMMTVIFDGHRGHVVVPVVGSVVPTSTAGH